MFNSSNSDAIKKVNDLNTKLTIIRGLGVNQKINTVTLQVYNVSYSTSIIRTIHNLAGSQGESREQLHSWLTNLFDDAFEFLAAHGSDNEVNYAYCKSLLNNIVEARNNLTDNIVKTYGDDYAFIGRIKSLAESIDILIGTLNTDQNTRAASILNVLRKSPAHNIDCEIVYKKSV